MSIAILQTITAMAPNSLTAPFGASGGVPPYVFSVVPGGAGGSINSSSGLYTSPSVTGIDTISVVDSLAASASCTILIGNALELVCDIISRGMSLSSDQVYLWDQKIDKGTDSRLYVAVSVISCKPFGNSNFFINGNQIQSTNVSALLDIDIFSRGPQARDQKELVLLSLNSQYAEQQMELNSFRVFPLSNNFINVSQPDGAAIPYRFKISVCLQYFVSNTSGVGYYDSIPVPSIATNP